MATFTITQSVSPFQTVLPATVGTEIGRLSFLASGDNITLNQVNFNLTGSVPANLATFNIYNGTTKVGTISYATFSAGGFVASTSISSTTMINGVPLILVMTADFATPGTNNGTVSVNVDDSGGFSAFGTDTHSNTVICTDATTFGAQAKLISSQTVIGGIFCAL